MEKRHAGLETTGHFKDGTQIAQFRLNNVYRNQYPTDRRGI